MGKKGDKMTGSSSESAQTLQDNLAPLGDIRIRKMFGGFGVFEADTMFALVDSQGGVFFKADNTNLKQFEDAGAEKHGRMPYYKVSDAVLNNQDTLLAWAQSSMTVSKKAKMKKK